MSGPLFVPTIIAALYPSNTLFQSQQRVDARGTYCDSYVSNIGKWIMEWRSYK